MYTSFYVHHPPTSQYHELGEQVTDDTGRDGGVGDVPASLVVPGTHLLLRGHQQTAAR